MFLASEYNSIYGISYTGIAMHACVMSWCCMLQHVCTTFVPIEAVTKYSLMAHGSRTGYEAPVRIRSVSLDIFLRNCHYTGNAWNSHNVAGADYAALPVFRLFLRRIPCSCGPHAPLWSMAALNLHTGTEIVTALPTHCGCMASDQARAGNHRLYSRLPLFRAGTIAVG